jgi:hypothetical protein
MLHIYIYIHVASICFKCFIRILQVFYLNVVYILQWLQMCFLGVSYVCCKCFNCFDFMLQVFSSRCCKSISWCCTCCSGPNCSSHLLQLLCPPACAWVWRGRQSASAGHEVCTVHGAGIGHGASAGHRAAWASTCAASGR